MVDDAGQVVGVADGGLFAGALPVTWRFPLSRLGELLSSTDTLPSPAVVASNLRATRTVLLAARDSAAAPGSALERVTCHDHAFYKIGVRTLEQILGDADQLSLTQANWILAYAPSVGRSVDPSTAFGVYNDPLTGASFVVPETFSCPSSGGDCTALSSNAELAIRITAIDGAPYTYGATQAANAFAQRAAVLGEQISMNPGFQMLPVQRMDGMQIQRIGIYYTGQASVPYQAPVPYQVAAPYPTPLPYQGLREAYVTNAARQNVYFGVLMRSYVERPGPSNADFFPAALSVYLSSFSY